MKGNILLIEDDEILVKDFVKNMRDFNPDLKIHHAEEKEQATKILLDYKIDIVLLDLVLNSWNGFEYFTIINELKIPQPPTIVISSVKITHVIVKAMKHGAIDFINKPFDYAEVKGKIERIILENLSDKSDSLPIRNISKTAIDYANLNYEVFNPIYITSSPIVQNVLQRAKKVANTNCTVLIEGDTGTGKELLAKYIHNNSNRSGGPMISINCGAISKELFESEAFGHIRGSFTSAINNKTGFFEKANYGTLFLDEIGELTLEHQVKLLRVIQDRIIHKVGELNDIPIDIRIICATNKNLSEEVRYKTFREDLFYRIKDYYIKLPSLSERREDILPLIYYFIEKFNKQFNKNILNINVTLLNLLTNKEWSGNIRELEFTIKTMMVCQDGEELNLQAAPPELIFPHSKYSIKGYEQIFPYKAALDIFQKNMILAALNVGKGSRTKAANLLGLTREHLSRLITQLDLRREVIKEDPSEIEESESENTKNENNDKTNNTDLKKSKSKGPTTDKKIKQNNY